MVIIHDKIKVAVRIRPPKDSQNELTTEVAFSEIIVKDKLFSFDNVFDTYSRQDEIFDLSIKPLIESFLSGINTTVLAYGQTGSGKTHTMGMQCSSGSYYMGIIPRFLEHIFSLDNMTSGEGECSVQFLELYNEEVRDLLQERCRQSSIRLVDCKNGVIVRGLIARQVRSMKEALVCLAEGGRSRTTAATAMNSESSRSHAIFSVTLTQTRANVSLCSKFNFVDLAGSERLQRTKAIGTRAKEGININFGLLALGNVIMALSEGVSRHIPYRDSKLTRLLEDSLGGSSKCLMIACICPSPQNIAETMNTLSYASRVKTIENRISINQKTCSVVKYDLVTCQGLQKRILELERELTLIKGISKESKFVDEASKIIEKQSLENETSYKDTVNNIDSLCYLISLENDANLLDSIPDHMTSKNRSLSFEKEVIKQEIKTVKELASDHYLDNSAQESFLDNVVTKLERSAKINGLKLNKVAIENAGDHKRLSQIKSHELRWKYLLHFISQRYILTDCLYREVIRQYEKQLSKSHRYVETALSHLSSTSDDDELVQDMISQIKLQIPQKRSSISRRKTPMLSMKNLENRLNYLFPLNRGDILNEKKRSDKNFDPPEDVKHLQTNIDSKPMITEQPQYQSKTLKRKRSSKHSVPKSTVIEEKQAYVRRNGLNIPIIKSATKIRASQLLKRARTVIDNGCKRPRLESITNNVRGKIRLDDIAKYLIKKPETKIDVIENFRLRNLR